MRFVNRKAVAEPEVLHAPFTRGSKKGKSELEHVAEFMALKFQGEVKGSYDFVRYKENEVSEALEALFHRKCAYCESAYDIVQPVDVEHYRPKGAVDGVEGHDGYWWLAMDWNNLLPSCIDCNRRRGQRIAGASGAVEVSAGKQAIFPLLEPDQRWAHPEAQGDDDGSGEGRLLLDPTRDPPELHLAFHVNLDAPIGLVFARPDPDRTDVAGPPVAPPPLEETGPMVRAAAEAGLSPIGAVTIQVYGLNRTGLVQARTRVMRDMAFLHRLVVSLGELTGEMQERAEDPARSEADRAFERRVAVKLEALCADAKDRMREKTAPDAPYSEAARAWARTMLAELSAQ
jgi:uncharacterized protein (TIGR02646 family)